MTIKGFRLVTGEYVIATVVCEEDHNIEISNPALVIPVKRDDDTVGITFRAYTPFAIGVQRLVKSSICTIFDTNEEFTREYSSFVFSQTAE